MGTKLPAAMTRLYRNMFVCKNCGQKMRSESLKVISKSITCRRCRKHNFRTVSLKKNKWWMVLMDSFLVYDVIFLILFGLFAFFILRKNRSSLKRQGWIFLYHTKVGLKLMDWASSKFEKVLKPLSML